MKNVLATVLAAVRLILSDVARLGTPTQATAVAGIVVPIIAAVAGVNVTAVEVAGWLVIAGTVAATLQNLTSGRAAKARKPTPAPLPPAPPLMPVPPPVPPTPPTL